MPDWEKRAGNVNPFRAPDGGMTLNDRADRAKKALHAYAKEGDCEEIEEHHVRDLLCDIQHYCDKVGLDFKHELEIGALFYEDEINEAPDEER